MQTPRTKTELLRPAISIEQGGPLKYVFDVHFNSNLEFFKGHFPDFKLLPGVALLKITLDYLPAELAGKNPKKIERLKYTGVILPDTRLKLELIISPDWQSADFVWASSEKSYASGRLRF